MTLKYKSLHDKFIDVKSQLDTIRNRLKERRKLVEKHREPNVEKQLDVAIQVDLVCFV